jgi:hypothetical protein
MKHGAVNILAFIGTHSAAQQLHQVRCFLCLFRFVFVISGFVLQAHPHPFSVRLALGLDAKNPGIVTASADLNVVSWVFVVWNLQEVNCNKSSFPIRFDAWGFSTLECFFCCGVFMFSSSKRRLQAK